MPHPHDPHFEGPAAVGNYMLDITGTALLNGDFDAFFSRCHLPQTLGTFEGTRILATAEDIQTIFTSVCAHLRTIGALELRRRTIAARFIEANQVQYTFSSQYVLPGLQLTPESVAHGRLVRTEGRWKIADHHYATSNPKLQQALSARPIKRA